MAVADLPKNVRERLRVELHDYKGRDVVSLRVWIDAVDGEAIPSSKGLTIAASMIPQLHRALADTERLALEQGILPVSRADQS